MNTHNNYTIGDHVWWGDPAAPLTGVIINFSANGQTVFVKNDRLNKNAKYEFYTTAALRLIAPCKAFLAPDQGCDLDCVNCTVTVIWR